MGQLQLSGSIIASDGCGGCSNEDQLCIPFGDDGCGCALGYNVSTGLVKTSINSPSSFVALSGVGAAPQPVTQGSFLYLKPTSAQLTIEITTFDPGGNVVAVIPYPAGFPLIQYFSAANYLVGIRVKGVGTLKYFAVGQL